MVWLVYDFPLIQVTFKYNNLPIVTWQIQYFAMSIDIRFCKVISFVNLCPLELAVLQPLLPQ